MNSDGALALESGSSNGVVGATDRTTIASILIRRHPSERIVNVWLIVTVLVGAMIAVADGLTRISIFDRAEAWNGPMEYVPYQGAVLFAGLTLPLMIAYARSARVALTEGLFLWFVFCTAAYTKDFSYIRFPGAPLFITDIVLLILLASIYLLRRPRSSRVPVPVSVFLLLFVGGGALSAARGLWGHRDLMMVLRDSALVAYALFLLIGFHLFRNWLSIKRVAVWFVLGAALSALGAAAWFISLPSERRFLLYGIYILISLTGVIVAMACRQLPPRIAWILVCVLCIGLLLANARSLFISLGVLCFLGLFAGILMHGKILVEGSVSIFVTGAVMVCCAAFLLFRSETGREFVERSVEDLASGVLNSAEDHNWQFRLSAWKEAWRRFEEYPLAGEGFGVPFSFEGLELENDPRPHNTFLTVLYKMGLTGFLPLISLLIYSSWRGLHSLRHFKKTKHIGFLVIVLLAQSAFCLYGMANLLLESPFLASLFWTSSGLILRLIRMLQLERPLQELLHGH
ncbi:MAG TPA: O-antigen ligase family protein [Candidatus Acidoferrum sp.]|nr:O-antigen ligase family protein [Candidatus Acidoferrum sp.]